MRIARRQWCGRVSPCDKCRLGDGTGGEVVFHGASKYRPLTNQRAALHNPFPGKWKRRKQWLAQRDVVK